MAMTSANSDTSFKRRATSTNCSRRFRNENPTFRISDDVIRRYHLAIDTRGFVILCGPSGTGKTWLAQAYAECVGARQKLVAVDPSWSSNEDLLGYLSPLDGFFHGTPFSEFVKESAREWEAANRGTRRPRVPRDPRRDEPGTRRALLQPVPVGDGGPHPRGHRAAGPGARPHVELTPNLRFAGTVNIDETTHGFADKVFDRAQVLELPLPREEVVAHLDGHPCAEMVLAIWDAPRGVAPFGFRVLDEIDAYVIAAAEIGTERETRWTSSSSRRSCRGSAATPAPVRRSTRSSR